MEIYDCVIFLWLELVFYTVSVLLQSMITDKQDYNFFDGTNDLLYFALHTFTDDDRALEEMISIS